MAFMVPQSLTDVDKSDVPFEIISLLKAGLVSDEMSYIPCATLPA
jgi:hypothetical protein